MKLEFVCSRFEKSDEEAIDRLKRALQPAAIVEASLRKSRLLWTPGVPCGRIVHPTLRQTKHWSPANSRMAASWTFLPVRSTSSEGPWQQPSRAAGSAHRSPQTPRLLREPVWLRGTQKAGSQQWGFDNA